MVVLKNYTPAFGIHLHTIYLLRIFWREYILGTYSSTYVIRGVSLVTDPDLLGCGQEYQGEGIMGPGFAGSRRRAGSRRSAYKRRKKIAWNLATSFGASDPTAPVTLNSSQGDETDLLHSRAEQELIL